MSFFKALPNQSNDFSSVDSNQSSSFHGCLNTDWRLPLPVCYSCMIVCREFLNWSLGCYRRSIFIGVQILYTAVSFHDMAWSPVGVYGLLQVYWLVSLAHLTHTHTHTHTCTASYDSLCPAWRWDCVRLQVHGCQQKVPVSYHCMNTFCIYPIKNLVSQEAPAGSMSPP